MAGPQGNYVAAALLLLCLQDRLNLLPIQITAAAVINDSTTYFEAVETNLTFNPASQPCMYGLAAGAMESLQSTRCQLLQRQTQSTSGSHDAGRSWLLQWELCSCCCQHCRRTWSLHQPSGSMCWQHVSHSLSQICTRNWHETHAASAWICAAACSCFRQLRLSNCTCCHA